VGEPVACAVGTHFRPIYFGTFVTSAAALSPLPVRCRCSFAGDGLGVVTSPAAFTFFDTAHSGLPLLGTGAARTF